MISKEVRMQDGKNQDNNRSHGSLFILCLDLGS